MNSLSRLWPAGLGSRVAAFLLDYLLIAGYIILLTGLAVTRLRLGLEGQFSRLFDNPWLFDLFAFCVLVLPVTLYFAYSESSSWQATWGKRRQHLLVQTVHGSRMTFPRSLLRSGLKFLPWQIAHTSLFHIPGWPSDAQNLPAAAVSGFVLVWVLVLLNLGLLAFTTSHRTLYDRLSGALVLREKSK